MPKIIIKEYDNTKSGTNAYSNFSVLVPGFIKNTIVNEEDISAYTVFPTLVKRTSDGCIYYVEEAGELDPVTQKYIFDYTKWAFVFDENGIYECTSQESFKKYIGKVAFNAGIKTEAEAPSGEAYTFTGTTEAIARDFSDKVNSGKLYTRTIRTDVETKDIGLLRDETYRYEQVTEDMSYDASKLYSILEFIGQNKEDGIHYGNQIAWELLGLGYPVLFKRMTRIDDVKNDQFFEVIKDKAIYDFRYIVNGLLENNADANNTICKVAKYVNTAADLGVSTGRGDCIALIDVAPSIYVGRSQIDASNAIKAEVRRYIEADKYAAIFAPTISYDIKADSEYGYNTTFPASFHYLACAARAAENYNEWYAVAGYTRGVSQYAIKSVGYKFGEAAIDALEPRFEKTVNGINHAVNLIVKIKDSSYLWGNRTAELLETEASGLDLKASHFLNIRQLCTTIKKQIYVACRRFTFDPNSDVLWINFCNAIKPVLNKMKADQGISDFRFIKVKTDKKALLTAKIRIVPIEAVEDFDISLTLEDSVAGIKAGIDESIAE